MLDLDDLKAIVDDFSIKEFAQKKPFIFTVLCLIVFLFVAGLVILLIQTSPQKKPAEKPMETFTADSPILIPDAPNIEKDYFTSRNTENEWSKAEIEKWFTYPDDNVMNELKRTNDSIADEILGATP